MVVIDVPGSMHEEKRVDRVGLDVWQAQVQYDAVTQKAWTMWQWKGVQMQIPC
jgi:hypothetical protein